MKWYYGGRALLLTAGWCLCAEGLWKGLFSAGEPFKFYTYQSNLLVFLFWTAELCLLGIHLVKRRPFESQLRLPPVVHGWVTTTILLTFFTYWTVLSSFGAPLSRQDAIIHYVVPLLAVADYLLFHRYGGHRWYEPLCWCASPVAYCGFVAVMYLSQNYFNGNYFPYFFMDFISHGWPFVAMMGVGLLLFYLGCGYFFYLWDKLVCFIKQKICNKKHA